MKNIMIFDKMKGMFLVGSLGTLLTVMIPADLLATGLQGSENTGKAFAAQSAQMKKVSGTVRDAATGDALAGVRISVAGNKRYAAMTEEDGSYTIELPEYVTVLNVVCDGYNMRQLPLNGRTTDVNTSLYASAFTSDYSPSEEATQAMVAHISDYNCDVSIDDQIGSALGGQIRSVMRSGTPGMGAFMLMNGINSLNANAQPLIVVDGVIMDMQYGRSVIHDGLYNNILANISVEDIDKVTVVRNGMALYGAKGANGVILIDTKRNKSMATKIDISISGKYETLPNLPDMMDASQYRTYVSEMLGTTGTKLSDFKFLRDEKDYYYYRIYHNNTDWSKEVYDESYAQSYSINVQGGDDVANYNLSVGYTAADATLKNNEYSRFNLRLNSDVSLTSRLGIRLDASYSDVNRNMRDDGVAENFRDNTITSPGFLSLIKAPFLNPYAFDTQGRLSGFLAGADDYLDEVLGYEASLGNPLSILKNGEGDNKNSFGNRLISLGIMPKYDFGKGLSVSEHFSFVMVNTDENYYLPVSCMPVFEIKEVGNVQNIVRAMSSHQYLTTSDTRINWTYRKGGSSLNLMGGFRFNFSNYDLNSMKGYNSGNDKTPNMGTGLSYKSTDGINDKVTTLTYYLLGDFNYRNKYLLNAGASVETSSRFGKDADAGFKMGGVVWGAFPSVSAAWIISNEGWYRTNNFINYLKVNAGFDMSGNDDIDLTASRTYFVANNLLGAIDGVTVGNIGNTSLQWETTKRITLGGDARFFNDRVALSGYYFKSKTTDLLSLQKLYWVLGHDTNWSNGGALENSGFDFSLRVKALNQKNWKWEIGATLGHYKNEVTKLPGGGESFITDTYGATVLTQVGSPVGLFYGYKTDGVFSDSESARAAGLYQTTETGARQYFGAGDMRFVSTDGDKEIGEKDRVVIGDPNPDFYGNIFTNLKYKNWGLNLVFNYCVGNDVFNYQRSVLEGGNYFYNQTTAMGRRWICEGQESDIPRITYKDPMGNSRFSDRWIEDGSYLRLKSLTLSYEWNINARFLQGITLWGTAGNLFTLTKYLGSDPEFSASNHVLSQGIDRGILPYSRNFSLGIKVNL